MQKNLNIGVVGDKFNLEVDGNVIKWDNVDWKNIKDWDEIVLEEDKPVILGLEKELKDRCPHLRKEGDFFCYCGLNIPKLENKKPTPLSPIYRGHCSTLDLQVHCMKNFEICSYYLGRHKR